MPALLALEQCGQKLRGLPQSEMLALLSRARDERAISLLLILVGRVDPTRAPALLALFRTHSSRVVRLASYYGLAIGTTTTSGVDGSEAAAFWKEMDGSILLLSVASPSHYSDFIVDTRRIIAPDVLAELASQIEEAEDPEVRSFLVGLLAQSRGDERVVRALVNVLTRDASAELRQAAANALAGVQAATVRESLWRVLQSDPEKEVRKAAIAAVGEGAGERSAVALIEWYPKAQSIGEQREIVNAVGRVALPRVTQFLCSVLAGSDETAVKADALRALAGTDSHDALEAICRALDSPEVFIRTLAAKRLGDMGKREARPYLERTILHDTSPMVRDVARASLAKLK